MPPNHRTTVCLRQSRSRCQSAEDPASDLRRHAEKGPEIEFQTLHTTPEDFEGTIKKGVSPGASSIELWQDYQGFPLVPDATLKRWATMIEGQ